MLAFVLVGVLSYSILGIYSAVAKRTSEESSSMAAANSAAGGVSAPAPRMITATELAAATGEDGRALYIAIKDPWSAETTVFDVSPGMDFYGPGGPYHVFAGKDATFGLSTSSMAPETVTGDLTTLTASQKDTHLQWHAKYTTKYPKVGYLVPDGTAMEDNASSTTIETKKDA